MCHSSIGVTFVNGIRRYNWWKVSRITDCVGPCISGDASVTIAPTDPLVILKDCRSSFDIHYFDFRMSLTLMSFANITLNSTVKWVGKVGY